MPFKHIKLAVDLYSHLPRYREIFSVFFKYGFADVLKLVHLQGLLEIKDKHLPQQGKEIHAMRTAERLRRALEELGPTFVKFGQILSSRRDLVNEEFFLELRKLQDQVAPFEGQEACQIVEKELGHPLDKIFKEFDRTPVASASMAQVHRATLRNGEVVAVKVQRPDITRVIETDLAILMDVARFLDRHVEELAVLNPVGVVREFSKTVLEELDFTNEASNMERFAEQFHGERKIRVPTVYPEFTTERVLTMEFLEGSRVDRPDDLAHHGINPVRLSESMSTLIFQQMFQYGFFHADPHPGNMFILKGGVTGLMDFGMMGNLNVGFREDIATMIMGLTEKDPKLVTRSLLSMSEEGFVDDPRKLEGDVETFAEHYLNKPLGELKLGFILNRLLDLLMRYKLRMKSNFYLGVKALTQIEAIGVTLNPQLNFVEFGKPFATAVIQNKYDFTALLKSSYRSLGEIVHFLKDFPAEFRDMYDRFRNGRFRIPIEHNIKPEGFEPLRNTMNHIANRLANAILASSVLICSALLIVADLQPKWGGVSIVGLLGLILGFLMGCRLFIAIWRRGGL